MSSLNKAMVIGRLGSDPEVRYTKANTAVATLSVATSRKYKDKNGELQEETEWHRITAWGRLAEICQKFLNKGSQVYIEGYLQTREWEDKQKVKRYTTEIVAQHLVMLSSKNQNSAPPPAESGSSNQYVPATNDPFDGLDEDLPF